MLSKRFYGAALMGAIVITTGLQGCGSDNPLCCTEFKAGANIEAGIGGGVQSQAVVQAIADFSGIAQAANEDLTTACRGIATDLDAPVAERDAAEGNADKGAKMKAYCDLAIKTIGTVKASAGGTLKLVTKAPQCSASLSAKANCEAKCTGGAKCDFKANPPKCTGGKLELSCKGECKAEGSAEVKCEGGCEGNCTGSCTAEGGVRCAGKCEGTCDATGSANGQAFDAQGNCQGTCKGTCSATAPSVKCTGSCQGTCSASCKAQASGSVKCDGKCEGEFEPIKCEGGKLEGGCQVEAKCGGSCDASVSAKAECTPPSIEVAFTGAANAEAAGKLIATLKANFGVVLAFQARLKIMADVGGTITANASAVGDIKASCIPVVIAAAADAVGDVAASAQVTGQLAVSAGGS